MDLIENLENAFAGKEVEKVPAASIVSVALVEGMEKSGCGFPISHVDPEKMLGLGESAHRYAGIESINLPFDLAIESEALGCEVDLREGNEHIPEITASPFFDDITSVEVNDDFLSSGRIPVVAKACELGREKYPEGLLEELNDKIEELFEKKIITTEAVGFLRGRSIVKNWIVHLPQINLRIILYLQRPVVYLLSN